MQSVWRMIMVCVLGLAWRPAAWALSCYVPPPETATSMYLVQLTDVAMESPGNGVAQLHVLKVYRGHRQELSRIQQAHIYQSCGSFWQRGACTMPQVFRAGQYIILYETGIANQSYQERPTLTATFGGCETSLRIPVSSQQQLEAFEQKYPAIWTAPEFEGIREETMKIDEGRD